MQHFQQLEALTNWSVNLACEEEELHAWQQKLQKLQEVREPWEQSQTVWLVKKKMQQEWIYLELGCRLGCPQSSQSRSQWQSKSVCATASDCDALSRKGRSEIQSNLARRTREQRGTHAGSRQCLCVCADRDAELRQLCVLRPLLLAGSEWTAASLPTPC